jgi:aminoglycoside phosphotransferase
MRLFRGHHVYIDDAEAAYLQKRVTVSLDMARTAASDCARASHSALANYYERALIALRRPVPNLTVLRSDAANPNTIATGMRSTGGLVQ